MPKDLYDKLCRLETLKVAANYCFDDIKDNFILDIFGFQDYYFNLESNLKVLANQIKSGTFNPHPLLDIDVPKTGLSVRPGSVLHIEDHIVMYAIAYLLAPLLDKFLPSNVYHFRVRKKDGRPDPEKLFESQEPNFDGIVLLSKQIRKTIETFEDWYEAWPEFVSDAQELYEKQGFRYLVETDISAYFENISQPLLADVLQQYAPNQIRLINLLIKMISHWSKTSLTGCQPERGIPQGNEVSSWLGTIYLVPLDKELLKLQRRGHIRYLRYVDDIKVFAKNKQTAREVVFLINHLLRKLHLNMQGSKTQIFEDDEVKTRLRDNRVEDISKVLDVLPDQNDKITAEMKAIVLRSIRPYFRSIVKENKKGEIKKNDMRLFKRVLTGFMRTASPNAVDYCLRVIWEQPILTEKIIKYLRKWRGRKRIQRHLLEMVFGVDELFPTQYLYLLPFLRQCNAFEQKHKRYLLKLGCNSKLHEAVRSEALLCLAMFMLTDSDFRRLKKLYDKSYSPIIKKVILAIFLKARDTIKAPMFEETIYEMDEPTNRFRKYIWAIAYSKSRSMPVLKKVFQIEKDPARLIIALQAALQSRYANTLENLMGMAKKAAQKSETHLAKAVFEKINNDAQMMLKSVIQNSVSSQ